MNWYYMDGVRQIGPVTDDVIISLIRSGAVRRPTPVWREGLPNWAEAGQTELTPHFVECVNPGSPPCKATAVPVDGTPPDAYAVKQKRKAFRKLIGFTLFVVGLILFLTGVIPGVGLSACGLWIMMGLGADS